MFLHLKRKVQGWVMFNFVASVLILIFCGMVLFDVLPLERPSYPVEIALAIIFFTKLFQDEKEERR